MTDRTLDPLDPIRSILTEVTEVLQDDIPTAKVVDQQKIKLTIKPEFARCLTYLFLWTFFILAKVVTMVWVEPILEGGAAALNLPPEQYGCPPFNRDQEILGNSPIFGFSFGDGFSMDETHLAEAFGFANICTLWDYSPSREFMALYFPFFEYSLVGYIVLDYFVMEISHNRRLLPNWFIYIVRFVTPINMLLGAWFRMIFVADAFTQTKFHTFGFLGLQFAVMSVAILNVVYVLLTGQGYPNHGITPEKAASYAKWYLGLNIFISSFKMYATFYIVFISPNGYGPNFYRLMTPIGWCVGKIIDFFWMVFNAILPPYIAWVRMNNEEPLEIDILVPDFETAYEDSGAIATPPGPASEATSLVSS